MVEHRASKRFEKRDGYQNIGLLPVQPPDVAARLRKYYCVHILMNVCP